MRTYDTRHLARLAILLFAVAAWNRTASAAAGYGFTASPARYFLETKPGSVEAREVQLVNNSSSPVKVEIYTWDLWYGKNQQVAYGPPGTYPHSAAPWITTTPRSLVMGPGQQSSYRINLATPADAKGGHYAVVFAEVKPLDPTKGVEPDGKSAQFGLRLGTVIYQTTVGKSAEQMRFGKVNVAPPSSSKPLSLSAELFNSGDTYVQPKLTARILDQSQKTVAKLTLEMGKEEPETVLPGQRRLFTSRYAGELRRGKYTVIISCAFGREGLETIQVPFEVKS